MIVVKEWVDLGLDGKWRLWAVGKQRNNAVRS
jgi:hypothetical protein